MPRRLYEILHLLRSRDEIGGGDPDVLLGIADRREQRRIIARQLVVGSAADGADHLIAFRAHGREKIDVLERRSFLLCPGIQEQLLQLGHHRTFDLQVGIAPVLRRRLAGLPRGGERSALAIGAEIDAADDRQRAVDHQDLPVVPIVGRIACAGFERIERIERHELHARRLQPVEELRGGAAGPVAVVDDRDLHAFLAFCRQQVAQMLAVVLNVLHDIVLEVHVLAGLPYCRENGVEALRAVAQQLRVVAHDQRRFGDRLLDREVARQHVALPRFGLQPTEHGLALRQRERTPGTDQAGRLRLVRSLLDRLVDLGLGDGRAAHGRREGKAGQEQSRGLQSGVSSVWHGTGGKPRRHR